MLYYSDVCNLFSLCANKSSSFVSNINMIWHPLYWNWKHFVLVSKLFLFYLVLFQRTKFLLISLLFLETFVNTVHRILSYKQFSLKRKTINSYHLIWLIDSIILALLIQPHNFHISSWQCYFSICINLHNQGRIYAKGIKQSIWLEQLDPNFNF